MLSIKKSDEFNGGQFDSDMLLGALPFAVVAVDPGMRIRYLNTAAEQFFGLGSSGLTGRHLEELLPSYSPLLSLISQAGHGQTSVAEYDVSLSLKGRTRNLAVTAAPLGEGCDLTVVYHKEKSIARMNKIQKAKRKAPRAGRGLAANLAQEVKKPLS
ncbi:MAG: PAS domain-containing protein, partial [Pseudomonadota bacterium]|nr:PAS domain-containing protein [Pseudomonadota bacterium]